MLLGFSSRRARSRCTRRAPLATTLLPRDGVAPPRPSPLALRAWSVVACCQKASPLRPRGGDCVCVLKCQCQTHARTRGGAHGHGLPSPPRHAQRERLSLLTHTVTLDWSRSDSVTTSTTPYQNGVSETPSRESGAQHSHAGVCESALERADRTRRHTAHRTHSHSHGQHTHSVSETSTTRSARRVS